MWLQVINKVKVMHQGQGQIKVEITSKERYSYMGDLHLTQMHSCLLYEHSFFSTSDRTFYQMCYCCRKLDFETFSGKFVEAVLP